MFCGGHVAVDEAHGSAVLVLQLVRVVQGVAHDGRDPEKDADRQRLLGPRRGPQDLGEAHAEHVLHRQTVDAVRGAEPGDGHDVRVLDLRRDLRLGEEHVEEVLVGGERRQEDLQGEEAPRRRGIEVANEKDVRRTTRGQPDQQLMISEPDRGHGFADLSAESG